MKLGYQKGEKLTKPDFFEKTSHFGDNTRKYPKNGVLGVLQKV